MGGQARKFIPLLLPILLGFPITSQSAQLRGAEDQEKLAKNPFAADPAAIREGQSLFRNGCAYCHGVDARGGGKAPDLTLARWIHGDSDAAIFRTITKGVPGTEMPANDLAEEDTWKIICYLRSISPTSRPPLPGNPETGEKIFYGKGICSQCHMVKGKGGRLGPDLSRIGGARSTLYLRDSIREPSKELAEGMLEPTKVSEGFPIVYETVTVVTKDGNRVTGVPKNEDTFTLQLMDQGERLHLFLKSDLREVVHERKSLMPEYNERMLNEKELEDLIAYLDTLRGQ